MAVPRTIRSHWDGEEERLGLGCSRQTVILRNCSVILITLNDSDAAHRTREVLSADAVVNCTWQNVEWVSRSVREQAAAICYPTAAAASYHSRDTSSTTKAVPG